MRSCNGADRVRRLSIQRPRRETYRDRSTAGAGLLVCAGERSCSWLAVMRLQVTAWESCFLWRRNDDGRYPCVLSMGMRPAKVISCKHYELGVCTDETSATRPSTVLATRVLIATSSASGICSAVRRLVRDYSTPLLLRIFFFHGRTGLRGVGRNKPHILSA
jgi:hypothetical protein